MSAVEKMLRERTFAIPSDAETGTGARGPLSSLRPGSSAVILGYAESLPASYARRLYDLGFAPGAEVTAVRRAPARDPVVYRIAECEIALRRSLAGGVLIAS